MKTKTLEVACERCGTPLVVGRREEWKDKIKVGLHPCAWCLANPPVGDPRWDAALNALRAERNGPPLPVPPPLNVFKEGSASPVHKEVMDVAPPPTRRG